MSVRLRIDRIVLDGYAFGPRERALFEASVSAELARLLTDDGAGERGSIAVPAPVAPPAAIPAGAAPDVVGVAVARSVHAGIPR